MDVIVLLKQVPDTETKIKIDADGKSIDTSDIKWIVNPYDEYAVEAALRLQESDGAMVTILSMGPERAVEAIRTALAMGADKGVLVDDPATEGSDALGKAKVLAAALRSMDFDLVFCGHRAVDDDENQVGIMVAELTGIPHLGMAVSIEVADGKARIERPLEGAKVTLEATMPALVTFGGAHAVWNPRYASLPGIMKAKKKPLEQKTLADLGVSPDEVGAQAAKMQVTSMGLPKERQAGRVLEGDTDEKAKELTRLLHEEAKVI
ncbi:MAG: electron transfer flavoprotein subunit beta/FixA family protein [Deltaproteobacteria bacterium]|nr:MAG: electron transfer flavoprotein subunit beta/FixA family protein [Deltaproteobacteria bacterium]